MNLPNKITTFRMVCVVIVDFILLFPWASCNVNMPVVFGNCTLDLFIAFILFVIASFSDFLDGYIARKYNLVTTFGKFMDPIADKLLVNSALIILSLKLPILVPGVCVVLMICRDLMVDALRQIASSKGKVLAANIFGKIKTVTQMIFLSFALLNDWPFSYLNKVMGRSYYPVTAILAYIATFASLLSGILYFTKNLFVFSDEEDNLKKELINLLKNSKHTLSSCESLTGGEFSSSICSNSGVSSFFKGAIVSYATEVKEDTLHIEKTLVDQFGVVSKEIAYEMAKNSAEILKTDISISFTGNAGPDVLEEKDVGLVYIGINYFGKIDTYEYHFEGDRNTIRKKCVIEGYKLLKKYLENK